MRTRLTIADDALAAARAMAEREARPVGDVISDLVRRALELPVPKTYRNGIQLLDVKPGGKPVTLRMVNKLRDEFP
jgi:hypothetical protein